jgi:hypothetical protein
MVAKGVLFIFGDRRTGTSRRNDPVLKIVTMPVSGKPARNFPGETFFVWRGYRK